MKSWAGAIAILMFFSCCSAKPYQPFVGAAWLFGGIGQDYRYHVADDGEARGIRINSGGGGRAEAGLTWGPRTLYLGLQHIGYKYDDVSTFNLNNLSDRTVTGHRFQSDRILIGGRLISHNPSRVHPLIGISVSGGWAKRSQTFDETMISNGQVVSSSHGQASQLSRFSVGFGGELGTLIRTYGNVDASLIGHLQYINSQIGSRDSGWMGRIEHNFIIALQLGLQYHFRRSRAG